MFRGLRRALGPLALPCLAACDGTTSLASRIDVDAELNQGAANVLVSVMNNSTVTIQTVCDDAAGPIVIQVRDGERWESTGIDTQCSGNDGQPINPGGTYVNTAPVPEASGVYRYGVWIRRDDEAPELARILYSESLEIE